MDVIHLLAGDNIHASRRYYIRASNTGILLVQKRNICQYKIFYSLKKKRTDASISYYSLARTKRYSNTNTIHNTYAERASLKMLAEDIIHMLAQDIMHIMFTLLEETYIFFKLNCT